MGDGSFFTGFRVVAGIIAGFAFVTGALIVVRGLRGSAAQRRLNQLGTRTAGTIVDNQIHSYQQGSLRFSPVVRFRDSSGRERTAVGTDEALSSFVAGTETTVSYDPDNPDRVLVGTAARAGGALVVGAVFVAFAVAVVVGISVFVGWTGDPTTPDLGSPAPFDAPANYG